LLAEAYNRCCLFSLIKNSVVLIDEPDAHLEILRQRQIYALLKSVALENRSEVIMATHSEVILDDAVDINLTLLLLDGSTDNIADRKDVRNALRTYGIEHYYKAKIHPRLLYIEGSTDIEILRHLAAKIHYTEAENILNNSLNIYYTQNIESEDNIFNQLDRAGGAFKHYRNHFNALRNFVPELKAVALFDNDNSNPQDEIDDSIVVIFWKEYEIENYFINPDVLYNFVENRYEKTAGELFVHEDIHIFQESIDEVLLSNVFENDADLLKQFQQANKNGKRFMLKNIKMSSFAEQVFSAYAKKMEQPLLLSKREFYRLIQFCPEEDIPVEVSEKLKILVKYLQYADVLP
jgi:hypothetical protein